MTPKDILDLYQSNEDVKKYVDHWAAKHHVTVTEILSYEITKLYIKQLLEKEESKNEEIKFEIHQDNGIT